MSTTTPYGSARRCCVTPCSGGDGGRKYGLVPHLVVSTVLLVVSQQTPFVASAEAPPNRSAAQPATGQLCLEGRFIEYVTLADESGEVRRIDRPGAKLELAPGTYSVREIGLQGGFCSSLYASAGTFPIAAGQSHTLRAGAPLTPHVTATRQGRYLELDYKLRDAEGRNYVRAEREDPPQFTVSKEGRELGTGSFEYG